MSGHTPGPWFLKRGFSDWNMPKQHEIWAVEGSTDDRDCIAIIPSLTPAPLGPKAKDSEYAARQLANASLLAVAADLFEALQRLPDDADMIEHNPDEGTRYFCCGTSVAFHPFPPSMRQHAPGCWYAAARSAITKVKDPQL